ncbi:cytochrome c oxidase assembly protein [Kaistia dalseonensis]|uniref:Cytochrome c oxidase assembly protein CtaG n=1 Tax=Kaistia dalseonensis TaxID=410840 RepID=A0ABU0HDQ4_9HYPH|nr:cytochrome c oxidase assembly protein [Kaistia dalseonensis]MCX5497443.1 cytochrome c oxidase assembly protein [Kaistia dalseonensis]MDQ0440082.1 cytochrome c oxidase assembly protein subunit 11 [Kaistia dalseonensis]
MSAKRTLGVTAAACAVFGAAMLGAAFAAVPLYQMFCQVTGYGGTTRRAEAPPAQAIDRTVVVRFDANVANGIGWAFRPEERQVTIRLGEIRKVNFVAENRTNRVATGQATFNVTPGSAGQFFNKIACFCFTEQTLKPGERVEMPVTFFVDPAMANDPDNRFTDTITLSYTFFPSATASSAPVAANTSPNSQKPL